MNLFEFLNTLENTLNQIDVKGKDNIDKMLGCFVAIENFRQFLAQSSNQKDEKEEVEETKGGEADGRYADIPTDSSNNSNGK